MVRGDKPSASAAAAKLRPCFQRQRTNSRRTLRLMLVAPRAPTHRLDQMGQRRYLLMDPLFNSAKQYSARNLVKLRRRFTSPVSPRCCAASDRRPRRREASAFWSLGLLVKRTWGKALRRLQSIDRSRASAETPAEFPPSIARRNSQLSD